MVEKHYGQRYLFNVSKRFFIFARFLSLLTFFYFSGTFLHLWFIRPVASSECKHNSAIWAVGHTSYIYCRYVKPATHEPGIRVRHPGRVPGFIDTRAALSGPGHPARASCSCVADSRRDIEKHCIAMLFVADSQAVGSCVARRGCLGTAQRRIVFRFTYL